MMSPRQRRRSLLALAALIPLASMGFQAPAPPETRPDPRTLEGTWKVDLRPTPGAPEYFKSFTVKPVEGVTFRGTFYGAEFDDGRLNRDWGAIRFAFTTRDLTHEYHHSGTLRDGRLDGISYCPGRKFLSVWSATPEK